MSMTRMQITREPDDELADVRVSIGSKEGVGVYLVFRGDPDAVLEVLSAAMAAAKVALPAGRYADHHRRPQG